MGAARVVVRRARSDFLNLLCIVCHEGVSFARLGLVLRGRTLVLPLTPLFRAGRSPKLHACLCAQ